MGSTPEVPSMSRPELTAAALKALRPRDRDYVAIADREGPVEGDDRRGVEADELVVQGDDLPPVGVARVAGRGEGGGGRSLGDRPDGGKRGFPAADRSVGGALGRRFVGPPRRRMVAAASTQAARTNRRPGNSPRRSGNVEKENTASEASRSCLRKEYFVVL